MQGGRARTECDTATDPDALGDLTLEGVHFGAKGRHPPGAERAEDRGFLGRTDVGG